MSALLPIINRLILQSPDSRSELTSFAGKTLTLNIAGLKLAGRITEDGLLGGKRLCRHRNYLPQQRDTENPPRRRTRGWRHQARRRPHPRHRGTVPARQPAFPRIGRIGTDFRHAGRHRQPCHRHRTRHQTNRQEHRRTNRRIFPRTRVRKHRQRSPCRLPRRNKQTARRRGTPQRTPRQARTRHLDRLTFRRHPT